MQDTLSWLEGLQIDGAEDSALPTPGCSQLPSFGSALSTSKAPDVGPEAEGTLAGEDLPLSPGSAELRDAWEADILADGGADTLVQGLPATELQSTGSPDLDATALEQDSNSSQVAIGSYCPRQDHASSECSDSLSGSDDLLDQLINFGAVPVEALSSLSQTEQPSGFSYLDPDFDIGIPSMPRGLQGEVRPSSIERLDSDLDGQIGPGMLADSAGHATQLRTCSEDEGCQVAFGNCKSHCGLGHASLG